MSKLSVCFVAPLPPPYGGIANWSAMLLDIFKESEDVSAAFINTAPKKRSTDGRSMFDRIFVSGADMLRVNKELKRTIKSSKPDVIHITTSAQLSIFRDLLVLKTAKKHGVPTVYHTHFGRVPDISEQNTREWQMLSKAINLASTVMTIDLATYNAIKKHLPQANAVNISNPLDLSGLPECSEKREKKIMFLGWVIPTKGITELVEAWNMVSAEFADYTLEIIGPYDEAYVKELKNADKTGKIVFTGEKPHPEAMEAMSRAELFILPSYTEGCPNVVVEAMALKAPVIATDVGAIPDMLEGGCGELIKPKSPEAIAQALRKMLTNDELRRECAQNAYKKVTEQYEASVVVGEYIKCWQQAKKTVDS